MSGNIWSIIKNIGDATKSILIVGGAISAIAFCIYQTQGLPPRVSKLEQDLPATKEQLKSEIDELKSQMDKNNTKTDIILDDVKIIKSLLMSGR